MENSDSVQSSPSISIGNSTLFKKALLAFGLIGIVSAAYFAFAYFKPLEATGTPPQTQATSTNPRLPSENLTQIKKLFFYDISREFENKSYVYNFYVANLHDFSTTTIYMGKASAISKLDPTMSSAEYIKRAQEYEERTFWAVPFPHNNFEDRIKSYGTDKIITDLFADKAFAFDIIGSDGKKDVRNYPIEKENFRNTIFSDDATLIASPIIDGLTILDNSGQPLETIKINFYEYLTDSISPWFFSADKRFVYGISSADTGTEKCAAFLWKIDIITGTLTEGPGFAGCTGTYFVNSNTGIFVVENNLDDNTGGMFPDDVPPSTVLLIDLESFSKQNLFTNKDSVVGDLSLSPNKQNVLYTTSEGAYVFNIPTKRHANIAARITPSDTLVRWIDDENVIYYKTLFLDNSIDFRFAPKEFHVLNIRTNEDTVVSFLKRDSLLIQTPK